MSEETLYDLRLYVSDCFNHYGYLHDGKTPDKSGYRRLSNLMIEQYDLDNNDVDDVVSAIEDMISNYIMDNSPKFTE